MYLRLKKILYYAVTGSLVVFYLVYAVLLSRQNCTTCTDHCRIKAKGFRGNVEFLVKKDRSGRIEQMKLIRSEETAAYASDKDIQDYFSRLEGQRIEQVDEVDGITGATVTTSAIQNALKGYPVKNVHWERFLLILVLWGLTVFASVKNNKKLLGILSAVFFVVIGVVLNRAVSIYSVFGLRSGFSLLPFLALSSVLFYRNIYCKYVCPYNFLQKYLHKIPTSEKFKLPRVLFMVKYGVLGTALLSVFFGRELYVEPYKYLFSGSGSWKLYIFPVFMLTGSVFFYRFWCMVFCPVGALMKIAKKLKGMSNLFFDSP